MNDIYGLNEITNQPTDIVSLLSEKNQFKTVDGEVSKKKKKASTHFARRSTNVGSSSDKEKIDGLKANKMLKFEASLKESDKSFQLPRRDRFNEDV